MQPSILRYPWVRILALWFCAVGVLAAPERARAGEVRLIIAAASSLTEVMTDLAAAFVEEYPQVDVRPSFAGSGVHRIQIERGAPVDVLVLASRTQIEPLIRSRRVEEGAMVRVAGNRLVLVGRKGSGLTGLAALTESTDLLLSAGDPVRVPAGEYAARLFAARGFEPQGRCIPAENVRQVLRYVETGVVAAGLVYRTDAIRSEKVFILESFGEDETGAVEILAAPLLRSAHPEESGAFVRFLLGDTASTIWAGHGFIVPERIPSMAPGPELSPDGGAGP